MDVNQADARAFLQKAILSCAIQFSDQLSFDFRLLLTQTRFAQLAGQLLWVQIKAFEPSVLVAPGYGAMPLAYAVAYAALHDGVTLDVLMVRDERKISI